MIYVVQLRKIRFVVVSLTFLTERLSKFFFKPYRARVNSVNIYHQ